MYKKFVEHDRRGDNFRLFRWRLSADEYLVEKKNYLIQIAFRIWLYFNESISYFIYK